MLSTKLKEAAGNSADATLYVDDVFSTYLYTGNGATQTINNGIDLAGKGGLVWGRPRNIATDFSVFDSTRGSNWLLTNGTNAQFTGTGFAMTSTGFSMTSLFSSSMNMSGQPCVSWTFRKAAKFFDVVTYTGTGSARTIAHSLGVAPGMVIVKRTDTSSNWQVYSNGLTSAAYSMQLNLTAAQASAPTVWNSTAPTSSVFSVGTDATVNASGGTYVAYLFAHDTSSTGIIQCGSFTTDGSGNATVNLGWEPQWLMQKSTGTGRWEIEDTMRGWNRSFVAKLMPNLSNAEETADGAYFTPTATGFTTIDSGLLLPSVTYIYMAIRMPNKPPTSGTQVFMPVLSTNDSVFNTIGFPVDLLLDASRGAGMTARSFLSRLQGGDKYLLPSQTDAEATSGNATTFQSNTAVAPGLWGAGANLVLEAFKRAPGFFDVVCYTGAVGYQDLSHNLGAVPELVIIKNRTGTGQNWIVGLQGITGTSKYLVLNSTAGIVSDINYFGSTWTSTKVLVDGNQNPINQSGYTYVMYLFATLAGISKVGSYTGNGTSQNIECGFAAGARFFLVKATSTTGSWWVWDSARGITAGNDPALQLNSTAAEITTADAVDPYSPGITVNQEATCSINANGVSYIFLAIA